MFTRDCYLLRPRTTAIAIIPSETTMISPAKIPATSTKEELPVSAGAAPGEVDEGVAAGRFGVPDVATVVCVGAGVGN